MRCLRAPFKNAIAYTVEWDLSLALLLKRSSSRLAIQDLPRFVHNSQVNTFELFKSGFKEISPAELVFLGP